MKYLLLILLTFNSYAAERLIQTDLRNNTIQGNEIVESKAKGIEKLIKTAKIKNNWRTGEFTEVLIDSLYSKSFIEIDELGNETEIIKHYHPLNWSYSFSDATAEIKEKQDKETKEKAKLNRKKNLRDQVLGINGKAKKDLNIRQLNEYIIELERE